MGAMAFQITSIIIVYSIVYTGADQRKHQSPASLAFVRGIHRSSINSPHKGPVTRKIFPFDDVIMRCLLQSSNNTHTYAWQWHFSFIVAQPLFLASHVSTRPEVRPAAHDNLLLRNSHPARFSTDVLRYLFWRMTDYKQCFLNVWLVFFYQGKQRQFGLSLS